MTENAVSLLISAFTLDHLQDKLLNELLHIIPIQILFPFVKFLIIYLTLYIFLPLPFNLSMLLPFHLLIGLIPQTLLQMAEESGPHAVPLPNPSHPPELAFSISPTTTQT